MFSFFKSKKTNPASDAQETDIEMQEISTWQKPFDAVPDEILLNILSYLNRQELNKLKTVSKHWQQVANLQCDILAKQLTKILIDPQSERRMTQELYSIANAIDVLKVLGEHAPNLVNDTDIAVSAKLLMQLGDLMTFLASKNVVNFELYRRTEPRVATYMSSNFGSTFPDIHHYEAEIWTPMSTQDMAKQRSTYQRALIQESKPTQSAAITRTQAITSFIKQLLTLLKSAIHHEAKSQSYELFANKKKTQQRVGILANINTLINSVEKRLTNEVNYKIETQNVQRSLRHVN